MLTDSLCFFVLPTTYKCFILCFGNIGKKALIELRPQLLRIFDKEIKDKTSLSEGAGRYGPLMVIFFATGSFF